MVKGRLRVGIKEGKEGYGQGERGECIEVLGCKNEDED
jgi:hypothetical protein